MDSAAFGGFGGRAGHVTIVTSRFAVWFALLVRDKQKSGFGKLGGIAAAALPWPSTDQLV